MSFAISALSASVAGGPLGPRPRADPAEAAAAGVVVALATGGVGVASAPSKEFAPSTRQRKQLLDNNLGFILYLYFGGGTPSMTQHAMTILPRVQKWDSPSKHIPRLGRGF